MKKYDKVVIKSSTKPEKKMMATFSNSNGGRTKTIHFGAAGMDDYTKTRDKAQRARYISRHRRNENWSVPDTAGSLSRWILWHKETRSASISSYKSRFGLK
tara:strand:- start:2316 stop:2618 length:303 start_codon:yes stop_codon:yes gene_type:complete